MPPASAESSVAKYTAPLDGGIYRVRYESVKNPEKYAETIVVVDEAAGQSLTPKPVWIQGQHESTIRSLDWSPDGKTLLSWGQDRTLRWWDVAKRQTRMAQEVTPKGGFNVLVYGDVEWAPDGKVIALGSQGGQLLLLDAATGTQLRSFNGAGGAISCIDWHPDGRRVVAAAYHEEYNAAGALQGWHKVILYDTQGAADFKPTVLYDGVVPTLAAPMSVTIRDDGKEIFVGGEALGRFVDPGGKGLLRPAEAMKGGFWYGNGGKWLLGNGTFVAATAKPVSVADDAAVSIVDRYPPRFRATGTQQGSGAMAVAPDKQLQANSHGNKFIQLAQLADGKDLGLMKGPSLPLPGANWSPDGKRIAIAAGADPFFAAQQTGVQILDAADGMILKELPVCPGVAQSAQFSPDGQVIMTGCGPTGIEMVNATTWEKKTFPVEVGYNKDKPTNATWVTTPAWLTSGIPPKNELVAWGGPTRLVEVVEYPSGKSVRKLSANSTYGMKWNVTGTRFLVDGCDLRDGHSGQRLAMWSGTCDFSGDGKSLVVWTPTDVVFADSDGKVLKSTPHAAQPAVVQIAVFPFSINAMLLHDRGVRSYDVMQGLTGGGKTNPASIGAAYLASGMARDYQGQRLLTTGKTFIALWTAQAWDTSTAPPQWQLEPGVEWSPQGCSRPIDVEFMAQAHVMNKGTQPIDLVWLDAECKETVKATIAPGKGVLQPTYLFHIWVIRVAKGKEIKRFWVTGGVTVDVTVP